MINVNKEFVEKLLKLANTLLGLSDAGAHIARQWADDLLSGRVESVAAIARRAGVLPNYVRRLTRLAFLPPKIVEAIVAGHQPPELTAKELTEQPLLWSEREHALGIN